MSHKPDLGSPDSLLPGYARYRQRLCAASPGLETRLMQGRCAAVHDFLPLARQFSALLFDAFGILNRGKEAIPGAPQTIRALQALGVPLLVVSNNASQSPEKIAGKLNAAGFSFAVEDIVSSGMAVTPFVEQSAFAGQPYYLVGTDDSRKAYAPDPQRLLVNHPEHGRPLLDAEYLLLCSDRDYYGPGGQEGDVETLLQAKALPILLANPDLAAPEEGGKLYTVAGFTSYQLEQRFAVETVIGLGKPFPPIFHLALARLGPGMDPGKILMVGDTLDTDILGGAAMGFRTCLALSGAYAGEERSARQLGEMRGILPDYVVGSIGEGR